MRGAGGCWLLEESWLLVSYLRAVTGSRCFYIAYCKEEVYQEEATTSKKLSRIDI